MSPHHCPEAVFGPDGVLAQANPAYQARAPQLRFADAIDEALGEPGHVLAELGTGTGKSYAYLVPPLLQGKRVVVTTVVKSLQEQLVNKDLPFLRVALRGLLGREIRFCYLKGKANYVCRRQVEKTQNLGTFPTPEAAAAWPAFFAWYEQTETGDLDEFNPPLNGALREAVNAEDCTHPGCFAAEAKAFAKTADVVVANHSLTLLDAVVRGATDDHAKVLPDADALILDEAHGLVDVASQTLGAEVSLGAWGRTVRKLERLGGAKWGFDAKPVTDALERWSDSIDRRMERSQERQLVLGDERSYSGPVVAEAGKLERYARSNAPESLVGEDKDAWTAACDAVASFAQRIARIGAPAPDEDPDAWVRFAVREGAGKRTRIVLNARPVDVAPYLREMIWQRFPTVVACSATLATPNGNGGTQFAFFREQAGVPAEAPVIELVAPSPFPYEASARLYVPPAGAITADRRREPGRYFAQQADQVLKLLEASGGRAFCLFTSNAAMHAVYGIVAPRLPAHWRVFVQGEQSRTHIVDQFRDRDLMDTNPCVLFATRSFFEGVDVAGRGLELVILDNLPFPVPSEPVYAAKCRRVGRITGDLKWGHFRTLTLPMVTVTVKQVVGRLIRTNTDRGVVAILDRRIVEAGYGAGMRKALPPMPLTEKIGDVEEVFP
jgi:ATP-dependent DNA helicase DinG